MTLRKYFAVAATTLALTGGALLVGPASPAFAAYNCTFDQDARNNAYAGYYAGNTTQPSSTGLSQAGIEAQCLLQYRGFSPGTIDGVFGTNSQNAAKALQRKANSRYGAGLTVDGKVGPATWPYLRSLNYNYR